MTVGQAQQAPGLNSRLAWVHGHDWRPKSRRATASWQLLCSSRWGRLCVTCVVVVDPSQILCPFLTTNLLSFQLCTFQFEFLQRITTFLQYFIHVIIGLKWGYLSNKKPGGPKGCGGVRETTSTLPGCAGGRIEMSKCYEWLLAYVSGLTFVLVDAKYLGLLPTIQYFFI